MQQYGKMKRGVELLGTSLTLCKGELVELLPARNLPQGGYFARPANGKWADGLPHSPDDSIHVTSADFSPLFGKGKPSRGELTTALVILLQWATGGNRQGNPYCKPPVRQALQAIARERGLSPEKYLDVEL